jgi:hypothetical protein
MQWGKGNALERVKQTIGQAIKEQIIAYEAQSEASFSWNPCSINFRTSCRLQLEEADLGLESR